MNTRRTSFSSAHNFQDDSSTSPSPNKLHKTPWGKMRDIIQTHRESVKKKTNRGSKTSPDVIPLRRRSFSDGGDSDAPPVLTLTIPSSEELGKSKIESWLPLRECEVSEDDVKERSRGEEWGRLSQCGYVVRMRKIEIEGLLPTSLSGRWIRRWQTLKEPCKRQKSVYTNA